uniref:Putative secreted protein n=1 Tax=Anopheles darlingi TaxID=43151 RepID=A0A2M4D0W7_ANODA
MPAVLTFPLTVVLALFSLSSSSLVVDCASSAKFVLCESVKRSVVVKSYRPRGRATVNDWQPPEIRLIPCAARLFHPVKCARPHTTQPLSSSPRRKANHSP